MKTKYFPYKRRFDIGDGIVQHSLNQIWRKPFKGGITWQKERIVVSCSCSGLRESGDFENVDPNTGPLLSEEVEVNVRVKEYSIDSATHGQSHE